MFLAPPKKEEESTKAEVYIDGLFKAMILPTRVFIHISEPRTAQSDRSGWMRLFTLVFYYSWCIVHGILILTVLPQFPVHTKHSNSMQFRYTSTSHKCIKL